MDSKLTLDKLYAIFQGRGIPSDVLYALMIGDIRLYGSYGIIIWLEDRIYVETTNNARPTKQMLSDIQATMDTKKVRMITTIENIRL